MTPEPENAEAHIRNALQLLEPSAMPWENMREVAHNVEGARRRLRDALDALKWIDLGGDE